VRLRAVRRLALSPGRAGLLPFGLPAPPGTFPAAALLLVFLSACGVGDGTPEDGASPPAPDAVERIVLGGRGSEEHVVPTRIRIPPGGAVEFVSVDHRVHTVTFLLDRLSPEVRDFLTRTGQDRSPPLARRGARFRVSLRGAPPGRYPFVARAHGGAAEGVLEVGAPTGSGDTVAGPGVVEYTLPTPQVSSPQSDPNGGTAPSGPGHGG